MTMPLGDPRVEEDEPRRRLGERGPWWVEAAMEFIGRFGLPTVIALALGGTMVWIFTGYVKAMAADVAATRVALDTHQTQMVNEAAAAAASREREIRILELICQMAAEAKKSDVMKLACGGK